MSAVHRRFDLVIFDCDGVLVDSERITNQVLCTMLHELGLALTLDVMFERFVGHSMQQCIELITEMRGAPPPESFVPEFRLRAMQALKEQIKPVPGVAEMLKSLPIPCCVASSGEHEKIRFTLGATGLLKHFDRAIFSVTDVGKPKPAPDLFLFAARSFGANPSRCAVVEDTPTGVRAAVAAGMHVFGFAAHTPEHSLRKAGAHEVFWDMSSFPRRLNDASKGSPHGPAWSGGNAVLRQAVAADVPAIHRVRMSVRENRLVSTVITEADTRRAIEESGRGWVIDVAGQVVAFAIGNKATGNIWALFVDPEHERRGYGRILHDEMVGWLRAQGLGQLWLSTEPGTRAERFYEKAGWKRAGMTGTGEVRFER